MSFADERAAIEKRFADNWSATTVKYENVPFTQPTTAWVALTIRTGFGGRASLGDTSPMHRYQGLIVVDIFVPEDSGTQTAKTHADTAEAIFRDVSFSLGNSGQIICRTPSLTALGVIDGWHQQSLSVPYHRDRII